LREHFLACIAFHSVEAAAVDGHDDTVQIDQIVLAQLFRLLPDRGCEFLLPQAEASVVDLIDRFNVINVARLSWTALGPPRSFGVRARTESCSIGPRLNASTARKRVTRLCAIVRPCTVCTDAQMYRPLGSKFRRADPN
jgi:hypothetical protein